MKDERAGSDRVRGHLVLQTAWNEPLIPQRQGSPAVTRLGAEGRLANFGAAMTSLSSRVAGSLAFRK
jgi:hypothetical protein